MLVEPLKFNGDILTILYCNSSIIVQVEVFNQVLVSMFYSCYIIVHFNCCQTKDYELSSERRLAVELSLNKLVQPADRNSFGAPKNWIQLNHMTSIHKITVLLSIVM